MKGYLHLAVLRLPTIVSGMNIKEVTELIPNMTMMIQKVHLLITSRSIHGYMSRYGKDPPPPKIWALNDITINDWCYLSFGELL